ncbi:hypothetical protein CANTEDRAFT_115955 [Yamadazyma tenuis ATCC 10573]|uniref:Uncharacterized protein n=1 Tax=Candida tenuis (strain ATCC 10573 / BCRC 21748 / CBS 615 / JCM 9827 / NBRC 10315 / NRRL Y-1498 / VKM Y-70) TaxID=590646 RepID=G3B9E1_CANTC|nr:uncharacterized protein CANTEDRAFT_115955 [Yamadazyma tenuis ATCC 10573]EGV62483.1 hypothetical protein CANTEDRAFT_115955 [Yamadazyma tenuis ATCC 10573]
MAAMTVQACLNSPNALNTVAALYSIKNKQTPVKMPLLPFSDTQNNFPELFFIATEEAFAHIPDIMQLLRTL